MTATRVKVVSRKVSAHIVEAERIVGHLAALTGVVKPGIMLGSTNVQHLAVYYPPRTYREYPNGVILMRREAPRQLINLVCHEFQHHLDALAGTVCERPHSRHDYAFYARLAALEERYLAYRAATAAN